MINVLKYGTDKKSINQLMERLKKTDRLKGIDAYKYCGILKLKEDPLIIQKKLRNEWE